MPEQTESADFAEFVARTPSLIEEGALDDALEASNAAAARWPGQFWPLFLTGRSLEGLGRRAEALSRYREALEANPSHPEAPAAHFAIKRLLAAETEAAENSTRKLDPDGDGTPRAKGHFQISDEIRRLSRRHARKLGVTPAVHPGDFILKFILSHRNFPTTDRAVRYYFTDGRRSAERLAELIGRHGTHLGDRTVRLLEFASGYGCVTRHLPTALADAEVVACDIHPQAVAFIERNIGVTALLSRSDPDEFETPSSYDVVFALSFFSHMPERTWSRWLTALVDCLDDGGLIVFTTQGLAGRELFGNPEIPPSGIWFKPGGEQEDLDAEEYGGTIVSTEYVLAQLERAGAELALYERATWWGMQDLYVARKPGAEEPRRGSESTFEGLVARVSSQLDQGQAEAALRESEAARRRWPNRFWAPYLAGRALAALDRPAEARIAYREALELDGDHPKAADARSEIGRLEDELSGP